MKLHECKEIKYSARKKCKEIKFPEEIEKELEITGKVNEVEVWERN